MGSILLFIGLHLGPTALKNADHRAAIPNPALTAFSALIGEWETTGTHPQLPGKTLHGQASFQWLEGGAFVLMHASLAEEGFPANVAIFGSDNTRQQWFMLYFDERQVSRKCDVTFQGNVLKWWRSGPEFSQRYTFTLANDGNTIVSRGEMSKDGKNWEPDLDLTYTRIR
ncbi:hypothetical protein [Hymenobacter lucidus]|nr:hypothetical protein [Hymenobacter lucidus]